MDTKAELSKSELRKKIKSRLAGIAAGQFSAAGSFAAQELKRIPGWDRYRSVLIFISKKDEMDTKPIMETIHAAGKSVFVPQINGDDLVFYRTEKGGSGQTGQGCLNHAPTLLPGDFPALVLTPGLAFDRSFNRLGRGRSYYDRFFSKLDEAGSDYTAVGLCMTCQLVEAVPADTWDKMLDMLLTENALVLPR